MIISIMDTEFETQEFQGYKKMIETSEDINSIFITLTGFTYDSKSKKFKKDDSIKVDYCSKITSKLFGYTMKSLTNFTKLTKNSPELVGFKSAMSYAGLCKIFTDNHHTCLLPKTKSHCIRSKEPQDFEITIEGLWKVIDDSYRQSLSGFIPELIYKNWHISEQIERNKQTVEKKKWNIFGKRVDGGEKEITEEL